MNIYKHYVEEPFSFLAINTTLSSDSPSTFTKNILIKITQTGKLQITIEINNKIEDSINAKDGMKRKDGEIIDNNTFIILVMNTKI